MARNNDAYGRPENTTTSHPYFSDNSTYRESTNKKTTWTDSERRHTGQYLDDNPYFDQMRLAQNKQDIDALYELAIQWEADYANRQMQLEENRAILEEQRRYDSPVEQVARQRAAGINPDLEGSGSGSTSAGSSAQLTNPGLADQTGQTKFSNQYDNASLVFEGINTAANFVGTLAGGVSGIMNAVSTMKMLPSQIALNEANAGLSNSKANEINELLAGNKKRLDLSNVAQGIQNSTATLQQLAEFSNLISPDTSDFAPILRSLGVSDENVAPYTDIIKQMHANPQMRDKYAKAGLAAKWSESENERYTTDLVDRMVAVSSQIEMEQLEMRYASTALQNSVANALNSADYINNVVGTEFLNAEAGAVNAQANLGLADQRLQKVYHDGEQWAALFEDKIALTKQAEGVLESLREEAKKDGVWTSFEYSNYQAALAYYMSLKNLCTDEFNNMQKYFLGVQQQRYNQRNLLDDAGNPVNIDFIGGINNFARATFDSVYDSMQSTGEVVRGWIGTSAGAVRDIGVGVGSMKSAIGINKIGSSMEQTSRTNSEKTGEVCRSGVKIEYSPGGKDAKGDIKWVPKRKVDYQDDSFDNSRSQGVNNTVRNSY